MNNNSINHKPRRNSLLYGILVASILITGIFLINPVNSIVTASLNQNDTSMKEVKDTRVQDSQINGSINVFEKSHDMIKNSIKIPFEDAAKIASNHFSNNITLIGGTY